MATGMAGGQTFTMYFGVLESFRMGDIELCNVPVHWNDARKPSLPDGSQPDGVLGTWIFYHFLTTLDYANQALILRRKDSAQLRRFRAEAMRACAVKLPLWLGGDHFPCTLGSLLDFGPKVVSFDTGGPRFGIGMTVAMAEQLGVEVDYDHPERFNNKVVYPITPERISLGRAVAPMFVALPARCWSTTSSGSGRSPTSLTSSSSFSRSPSTSPT
ncbi:hypothetical protein [Allorhizocola rhizosphaerae]|uniref:hypothetical protein n=1 Tax=Allorhizocola rhizosphaerae TaxID=1872709 RepID=UPI001FE3EC37|nr:hypothetical protein [Allorhizocola rhizosphaerae]